MLSRRLCRALATSWTAAALLVSSIVVASADDPGTGTGTVEQCGFHLCLGASSPGTPAPTQASGSGGGSGGSGTDPTCSWNGFTWPCYDKELGWFNGSDGCYWRQLDPQPAAGDPDWAGHQPGDGAVYAVNCRGTGGALTPKANTWLQNPPPGYGGGVDLGVLAQQAVDQMLLEAPKIGITPKPGSKGVVGMPVWMWTEVSPTTWGPDTKSVTAGGVTVTATAKVSKVEWSMGDGTKVTCTSAGTPWTPSAGQQPSPDCGHTYATTSASQPGAVFHVTATSTWVADWSGGGQTGQLTLTRTSAVDLTVGEVQVLN